MKIFLPRHRITACVLLFTAFAFPLYSAEAPGSSAASPLKVKFQVLGGWKYIEGKTPTPADVKQLEGKWVELGGFMLPINETQDITRFVLVQSVWGCCFGQIPEVNHVIVVEMEKGKKVDFISDFIRVVGKLSLAETREEGYLVSIYRLSADRVLVK
jgi:hypothetical protein